MAEEQKNTASEQQVDTGINFNDLVLARNIIHIASERGAFTDPNEYREIGQLYSKLDTFIKGVQEQAKAKEEEASKAEKKDTDKD